MPSSRSPRRRSAAPICTCTSVLGPFLTTGDILGHEPMGIVQEVGSAVTDLAVGDRVVIPFEISCGALLHVPARVCTRSARRRRTGTHGTGAELYGYTSLYGLGPRRAGPVPAGASRRDTNRSRSATTSPMIATSSSATSCPPHGRPCSTRMSPTAAPWWSSGSAPSASSAPGSAGTSATGCIARRSRLPERRTMAERHGIEVLRPASMTFSTALRELTDGRGADGVIDAVGMEAHGNPGIGSSRRRPPGSCPMAWRSR